MHRENQPTSSNAIFGKPKVAPAFGEPPCPIYDFPQTGSLMDAPGTPDWTDMLQSIGTRLKERQNYLYWLAESVCEAHWDATTTWANDGRLDQRAQYMITCDRGRAGIRLYWRRVWAVYSAKRGKRVQRSVHIKLGEKSFRYKPTRFPLTRDWERPIIERIEQQLEPIRRESRWLARIAQDLANHPEVVRARRSSGATKGKDHTDVDHDRWDEELPEVAGW